VKPGPARVLEALRGADGRTCSGETLSAEQGVSRAQVWKHVETLRACGYTIDAAAGGGYRLTATPDRLYPEEIAQGLQTRWLARSIEHHESIDSTNRAASERAREGCAHGTTVIAEGQSAGRGRLGRSFYSPPGLNLYSSSVLRPRITTAAAPTWILAAAIGVANTIAEIVGDAARLQIKWPNDVLLDGRKTSGILMELGAEATRVDYLVLGIGVNLNADPADFPEEFRERATSVSAAIGRRVDRLDFARRLYAQLEDIFDRCEAGSFEAVRPEFEAHFRMAGRAVRVLELGGGELSGTALGIAPDGALRVRGNDGSESRVIAGDVTLARENA
jgi:BirA family biotin operon repressor/biotin-[acetyl-CoA-carboxylase] ligase